MNKKIDSKKSERGSQIFINEKNKEGKMMTKNSNEKKKYLEPEK